MIERRDQVLEHHLDPLSHQVVQIPPIRPLVGVECNGSTKLATTRRRLSAELAQAMATGGLRS